MKRATLTTREYLISATLPDATDTYTVIPHETIINESLMILSKKGFSVERELYRCNENAKVTQGVYHLKYGEDPDLGLMFTWGNSYDKSMKFKCSIGAFTHTAHSSIIGGDMGSYARKHTGTAKEEVVNTILDQIENAEDYFKQLIADKEVMKTIVITEEQRAGFIGQLYIIHELFNGEQLVAICNELKKPSFHADGNDTVWYMYNAIIFALQKAHPKTWMEQQRMTHLLICNEFGINGEVPVAVLQEIVNKEVEKVINETLSEIGADTQTRLPKDYITPAEVEIKECFDEVITRYYVTMEKLEDTSPCPTAVEFLKPKLNTDYIDDGFTPNVPDTFEPLPIVSIPVVEESPVDGIDVWECKSCRLLQGASDTRNPGDLCVSCLPKI